MIDDENKFLIDAQAKMNMMTIGNKQVRRLARDRRLFEASPFLAGLMGGGSWREMDERTGSEASASAPTIREFRRGLRRQLDDPEMALINLRRFRVRTLLDLASADLDNRIKPHQLRARLRGLSETLVLGAWWIAESSLRDMYVHPLILERRSVQPPVAVFSLSRLGSGEPWYGTGPAPIFVHSRAAEYSSALTEKDFELARRSGKEWLPAREYFHRLASRTMSYLSVPNQAGKGFQHMAEASGPDQAPLLPGALVILFSAFEEHFHQGRPVKERLSLMRLRFLVGQEKLGRAVERAARESLMRTAIELGKRLRTGINAWYRDRAAAEGLPLIPGGILDIERRIRLAQFQWAGNDPDFWEPSPLKALNRLAERGALGPDERLILYNCYSFQWLVINRFTLLGKTPVPDWDELQSGRLDDILGLAGAGEQIRRHIRLAKPVLNDLSRERAGGRED